MSLLRTLSRCLESVTSLLKHGLDRLRSALAASRTTGPDWALPEQLEPRLMLSSSISGTVYADLNADGVLDAGETGQAGWEVFVDANGNGLLDEGEPGTVTDQGGAYTITDSIISPSSPVTLLLTPQSDWIQTSPISGGHLTVAGSDIHFGVRPPITMDGPTTIDSPAYNLSLTSGVGGTWNIDWGDGTGVVVGASVVLGETVTANHLYLTPGDYQIRAWVDDGEAENPDDEPDRRRLAATPIGTRGGDLYVGFGSGGLAWPQTVVGQGDTFREVAVQSDGKIVAVGLIGDQLLIARFHADGTPDRSFGADADGSVALDLGVTGIDIFGLGLIPSSEGDNGIYVGIDGLADDFTVVKLTANGDQDLNYGTSGVASVQVTDETTPRALAVDSEGRAIAGGAVETDSSDYDAAAVRYTLAGQPDPAFGTGGFAKKRRIGSWDMIEDIAVDDSNRTLIAGASWPNSNLLVVRMTAGGQPDPSFGNGGVAEFSIDSPDINSVVVQPASDGGGIFVGGSTAAEVVLAKLTDSGNQDSQFGTNGEVQRWSLGGVESINHLALQPNGGVVMSGIDTMARLFPDTGGGDITYGRAGHWVIDPDKTGWGINALAVTPAGRIVAAGSVGSGTERDGVVAVYEHGGLDVAVDGWTYDATVAEADELVLTESMFIDPDQTTASQFVLTQTPVFGTLFHGSTELSAGAVITAADLAAGDIKYDHPTALSDGADSGRFSWDSFRYVARTSTGDFVFADRFAVTVQNVDDAPQKKTDRTDPSLYEGGWTHITTDHLWWDDVDTAPTALVYQINALPASGDLLLDGVPLGSTDTFTQQDIHEGRLIYVNTDRFNVATTNDDLDYSITDGTTSVTDTLSFDILHSDLTLTVNTLADVVDDNDEFLSLREAFARAQDFTLPGVVAPEDQVTVITFAHHIVGPGSSILLDAAHGELAYTALVPSELRIIGPGPDQLSIDGGGHSRVMSFTEPPTQAWVGYEFYHHPLSDLVGDTVSPMSLHISGLTVTGGSSNRAGGGLRIVGGDELTLQDVTLRANRSGSHGGGIAVLSTAGTHDNEIPFGITVDLTDVHLSHNRAAADGGGLFMVGGSALLTNVVITENRAGDDGGGLAKAGHERLTIEQSWIHDNEAVNGGGLATSRLVQLSVRRSTIAHNTATQFGGGLFFDFRGVGGNPFDDYSNDEEYRQRVITSTVSGNRAGVAGGGIFVAGSTPATIVASTIARNVAKRGGGVLFSPDDGLRNSAAEADYILSSIVADNVDLNGQPDDIVGRAVFRGSLSQGFGNNIIGAADLGVYSLDGWQADSSHGLATFSGIDLLVYPIDFADAHLGNLIGTPSFPLRGGLLPLELHGGRLPMHALKATSVAIDAGAKASGNSGWESYDQRGRPFADGDGYSSEHLDEDLYGFGLVDAGAYELQPGRYLALNANYDAWVVDPSLQGTDLSLGSDLAAVHRDDPDLMRTRIALQDAPIVGSWTLNFPADLEVWRDRAHGRPLRVLSGVPFSHEGGAAALDLVIAGQHVTHNAHGALLRAEFASIDGDTLGDALRFTVSGVDLDVDTDNDNLWLLPDRSEAEERLEQDPLSAGKTLIPSADRLVPMTLEFLDPYRLDQAEFTLTYDETRFQVYNVPTNPVAGSIGDDGNLVPSGTAFTPAALGEALTGREATLWIETLDGDGQTPYSGTHKAQITVEVDPDGEGVLHNAVLSDEIRVTADYGETWQTSLSGSVFASSDEGTDDTLVIFIVDRSIDTESHTGPYPSTFVGDVSGTPTILDAEVDAIEAFVQDATGALPRIGIVLMDEGATILDMDPNTVGLQTTSTDDQTREDILVAIGDIDEIPSRPTGYDGANYQGSVFFDTIFPDDGNRDAGEYGTDMYRVFVDGNGNEVWDAGENWAYPDATGFFAIPGSDVNELWLDTPAGISFTRVVHDIDGDGTDDKVEFELEYKADVGVVATSGGLLDRSDNDLLIESVSAPASFYTSDGYGLAFDGVSYGLQVSDATTPGTLSLLTSPAELTLTTWLKVDETLNAPHISLFSKGDAASGGFELIYRPQDQELALVIRYTDAQTGQELSEQFLASDVDLGADWHHVGVTVAQNDYLGHYEATFYLDGRPLRQSFSGDGADGAVKRLIYTASDGSEARGFSRLGEFGDGPLVIAETPAGYTFSGAIRAAKAYGRALSDQEVATFAGEQPFWPTDPAQAGTNFEAALRMAQDLLDFEIADESTDENRAVVAMLSSGYANLPDGDPALYGDEASELEGYLVIDHATDVSQVALDVRAYAAGRSAVLHYLQGVDPDAKHFIAPSEVSRDLHGQLSTSFGPLSLGGWTVYVDSNGNGSFDAGEPNGVTDANGNYAIPTSTVTPKILIADPQQWSEVEPLDDADFELQAVGPVGPDLQLHDSGSIWVNNGDDDRDGLIDYLDGFDGDGAFGTDDDVVARGGLTPLTLDLSRARRLLSHATVTFSYDGSDPAHDFASGAANGLLRLWNSEDPDHRSLADFIEPDRPYRLAELGLDGQSLNTTLWVEATAGAGQSSPIEVFLNPQGGFGDSLSDTVDVAIKGGSVEGTLVLDRNGNGAQDEFILPQDDAGVIFLLDVSTSMGAPFDGLSVGDLNGDGTRNQRLDAAVDMAQVLNHLLISRGLGADANISVLSFGNADASGAVNGTIWHPTAGGLLTTTPAADLDLATAGLDVDDMLGQLQLGSNADLASALDRVIEVAGSHEISHVLVLSDGRFDTAGAEPRIDYLQSGLGINLVGLGVGADASIWSLRQLDPDAVVFEDGDEVRTHFSGPDSPFAESGVAGRRVYLDTNADRAWSPDEPSAFTRSDGSFVIGSVAADTYTLRVSPDLNLPTSLPEPQAVQVTDAGQVDVGMLLVELDHHGNSPDASDFTPDDLVDGSTTRRPQILTSHIYATTAGVDVELVFSDPDGLIDYTNGPTLDAQGEPFTLSASASEWRLQSNGTLSAGTNTMWIVANDANGDPLFKQPVEVDIANPYSDQFTLVLPQQQDPEVPAVVDGSPWTLDLEPYLDLTNWDGSATVHRHQEFDWGVEISDPNAEAEILTGEGSLWGGPFLVWRNPTYGIHDVTVTVADRWGREASDDLRLIVPLLDIDQEYLSLNTPASYASYNQDYDVTLTTEPGNWAPGDNWEVRVRESTAPDTVVTIPGSVGSNISITSEAEYFYFSARRIREDNVPVDTPEVYVPVIAPTAVPSLAFHEPYIGAVSERTDVSFTLADTDVDQIVNYEVFAVPVVENSSGSELNFGGSRRLAVENTEGSVGEVFSTHEVTIDPTWLPDGAYQLQVIIDDEDGVSNDEITVKEPFSIYSNRNPSQARIGNLAARFTDLSLQTSGLPLAVHRVYEQTESDVGRRGELGYGWRLMSNRVELSYSGLGYDPGGNSYFKQGSEIAITLPNGDHHRFAFEPVSVSLYHYQPNWRIGSVPNFRHVGGGGAVLSVEMMNLYPGLSYGTLATNFADHDGYAVESTSSSLYRPLQEFVWVVRTDRSRKDLGSAHRAGKIRNEDFTQPLAFASRPICKPPYSMGLQTAPWAKPAVNGGQPPFRGEPGVWGPAARPPDSPTRKPEDPCIVRLASATAWSSPPGRASAITSTVAPA